MNLEHWNMLVRYCLMTNDLKIFVSNIKSELSVILFIYSSKLVMLKVSYLNHIGK